MDILRVYTFVLCVFCALSGCNGFEVCARTQFEITAYCDDNQHCCGNGNLECCSTALTEYAIVGIVLGSIVFAVLGIGLLIVIIKHIQLKRGKAMLLE